MITPSDGPAALFTVGLPGSGKTTWAERAVEADKTGKLTIVNRDHIRAMLRRPFGTDEELVTVVQLAAIRACLSRDMTVIVDDTNLNPEHLQSMQANLTASVPGVSLGTVMAFLFVHPQVCVQRDAERPEPVGEVVIWGLFERWRETWPQMNAAAQWTPGNAKPQADAVRFASAHADGSTSWGEPCGG